MNQTTDDPRGMPVDPCPDWFTGWSEAIDNGWLRLADDEPGEPVALEPWQFTDKALVAELAGVQRQLSQRRVAGLSCWVRPSGAKRPRR